MNNSHSLGALLGETAATADTAVADARRPEAAPTGVSNAVSDHLFPARFDHVRVSNRTSRVIEPITVLPLQSVTMHKQQERAEHKNASEQYLREVIEEGYGVGFVSSLRPVPSEADLTAIIETLSGTVVAKTTTDHFGRWSLTLQAQAQSRLREERLLSDLVPAVIANEAGEQLTFDGDVTTMLMTFQQGASISDVELTSALVQDVAYLQYQSSQQYAGFTPDLDMRAYPRPWDLGSFRADNYDLERYLAPDELKLAAEIFSGVASVYDRRRPVSPYTAEQFIFGDFNLSNVLCTDGAVSGLIDFGDAVVGTLLADIAIALCYLQLHDRGLERSTLIDVYMTELAKYQDPPSTAELVDLGHLVRGRALMVLLNGREVAQAQPARSAYALRYDSAAAKLLAN